MSNIHKNPATLNDKHFGALVIDDNFSNIVFSSFSFYAFQYSVPFDGIED